ncbi:MAG TPA: nucleoside kinase [Candidatus Cloacimonas sp.]|jgi:uridine kinase|nr:nucleoside kinase [Candidatus Cloacimonas sp.]MDD2250242.1 nucleoside kinase [Candidatus Cloacimonadota bacterium]MCK9157447.1 nucleoside kinase [Candidatus Cloacimonas sp.]MCK9164893.1 nucleoside kinase [Candidatus Cloacimonas sp.]MDD3734052.1 nucleoside kinase [Candidatus Cloacimonadota bacterium]
MILDIRLNGIKHSLIEVDKPLPLTEILKRTHIDRSQILSYKINHREYVNEDYIPDRETLIDCITYLHPEGYRIYQDSTIFIMCKALHTLMGTEPSLVVEHSIADGVFCEVFNSQTFTEEDCSRLIAEMQNIVENNLPIEKITVKTDEALDIFSALGRNDVIKNIKYHYQENVELYRCGKYYDCYNHPLTDRTGKIKNFDIVYHSPGFILRFPSKDENMEIPTFQLPYKLFARHQEHDKWLDILRVHNIIDINKLIDHYEISEFIQVEEALHEKKIAEIAADIVTQKEVKLILIAGPSSSGKTTFAKRLGVQLQACKAKPVVIGMDDYFLPRTKTPRKPNGEYDFETIYAMDLEYLNMQMNQLLDGEQIELPRYDFTRGIRRRSNTFVKLGSNSIIVMEGIHGLNEILTASIPANRKLKIYVSALNQLNIDNHNRISTTDCRLLRRIIRDHRYRGYSAEETLMRWQDVRDGEDKYIFPYQENADYMFNSSLTYEIGVIRKYAWKLLLGVSPSSSAYMEAKRLSSLIASCKDIADTLVPYNSIIREFTDGSIFRY